MKFLYSSWMQELDSETINCIGIPSIVLMENASRGAAAFFKEVFPLSGARNVLVIVGKGNNGGDGIAVGRILHQEGYDVEFVFLSEPDTFNADPFINFNIIKQLNLKYSVIKCGGDLLGILSSYSPNNTFIIDAVFGTGLTKPVEKGFLSDVIRSINDSGIPIASIDIPSGLSESFSPGAGAHVNADVTATFQCMKLAHIHPDGNKFCGRIKVIDIGIPRELISRDKYYVHGILPHGFLYLLGERDVDSHKGNFGHTLNISGSLEKPGAGILSAFSVLRSGAGLCTAAVGFENPTAPVIAHPEIMTLIYRNVKELLDRLDDFNTLLLGPGLGNSPETLDIVSGVIEHGAVPIVLDADALNVLQGRLDVLSSNPNNGPLVLTPHPAEFSRLTGLSIAQIQGNRVGTCRDFAVKYNAFVILKGHHTLIGTPQGRVYVNLTGNPGMATAGSGDVLCGMVAGMLSQFYDKQGVDVDTILQAAVFLHGYAGDIAALDKGQISLTATDIIESIPRAIMKIHEFTNPFQIT